MRFAIGFILACILLFGCAGGSGSAGTAPNQEAGGNQDNASITQEEQADEAGSLPGILEVPEKEEIVQDRSGSPAASQQDCATLAPDCESCLAKSGCGWCKSSNSCFYGKEDGPLVSSCPEDEWAYDESACALPSGGESCSSQTNCASCLSGSGCKWCIQGSVCRDDASDEKCFGNWLTESFQCNFASR